MTFHLTKVKCFVQKDGSFQQYLCLRMYYWIYGKTKQEKHVDKTTSQKMVELCKRTASPHHRPQLQRGNCPI